MVAPLYLLVVTYAAVQLFLHVTEQLFRTLTLSIFLLLLSRS
jgi:hypothetical protein